MIHNAEGLSPDQKIVIEGLLGRRVLEGEEISVRAILPPARSPERRKELGAGLTTYLPRSMRVVSPPPQRKPKKSLSKLAEAFVRATARISEDCLDTTIPRTADADSQTEETSRGFAELKN